MSTELSKLDNQISGHYGIHLVMTSKISSQAIDWESLSSFVRDAIERSGKSYRIIAESVGLSHGVVGNIINKRNKRSVGLDTLWSLSNALGIPIELIIDAARGNQVKKEEITDSRLKMVLSNYQNLPAETKEFLSPLIDALEKQIELSGPAKPRFSYALDDFMAYLGEEYPGQAFDTVAVIDIMYTGKIEGLNPEMVKIVRAAKEEFRSRESKRISRASQKG